MLSASVTHVTGQDSQNDQFVRVTVTYRPDATVHPPNNLDPFFVKPGDLSVSVCGADGSSASVKSEDCQIRGGAVRAHHPERSFRPNEQATVTYTGWVPKSLFNLSAGVCFFRCTLKGERTAAAI